jgi:hypothetical protein
VTVAEANLLSGEDGWHDIPDDSHRLAASCPCQPTAEGTLNGEALWIHVRTAGGDCCGES